MNHWVKLEFFFYFFSLKLTCYSCVWWFLNFQSTNLFSNSLIYMQESQWNIDLGEMFILLLTHCIPHKQYCHTGYEIILYVLLLCPSWSCTIIRCINRFTSLCKNLFNLLEFLAEAFRCNVHHFQCLTVPVELGPSSNENDAHCIEIFC